MMTHHPNAPERNTPTFGALLRLLRRRARLTQAELGIAVGYSDGQICRLETGRRPPDLSTLAALFLPALDLDPHGADARRLLALAAEARAERVPAQAPGSTAISAGPPGAADALIGRAAEQALIRAQLTDGTARLITLIGPAGIGKTRLAAQIAQTLQAHYRDGAHFIDLSSAHTGDQAAVTIAQALGVSEEAHPSAAAALRAELRPRHSLLVLDNMEQVSDAGPLLRDLLASAPDLALLVTSRIALRLAAGHTLALGPLALPDLADLPPPAELARIEAVALLLARLRAHTPEIEPHPGNALALAAICAQVDGVPLAIELAAAHGRFFSPQELLSEVAQHTLQIRRREGGGRHSSLAAALAWSYEHLPPACQALLARLSAFASGWTVEALAACDLEEAGRSALLEQLDHLLDHSLVQRRADEGRTRFSLLAMVRAFAADRLDERGERATVQRRLLEHYHAFAREAAQHLAYGTDQALWVARMEAEHENLRACLRWALEAGEQRAGLRLASEIGRFWYARGYLREGQRWLESFLELPDSSSVSLERARALDTAALLAWRQGNLVQAEAWYTEALTIFRAEEQPLDTARVLMRMGVMVNGQGLVEPAIAHYEASLALYRSVGSQQQVVTVLHNLGNLYCNQNSNAKALELYQECLALYEQIGDLSGIALIQLGLGAIARDQGDLERAYAAFSQSLDLARRLGDEWNAATALLNLGDVAADQGRAAAGRAHLSAALAEFERLGDQQSVCQAHLRLGMAGLSADEPALASGSFRQGLMLAHALGFHSGIADGLEGLAACALPAQPRLAARLLGCAAALRSALALPVALADQHRYTRTLQAAQAALRPDQWAQAWAAGQALPAERAVALALAGGI